MSTEATIPFSWLKSVPDVIKSQDEIPLWGYPPPFPWELFNQELAKIFELPDLKVSCLNTEWVARENLLSKFGQDPAIHPFSVTPLAGLAYWICSKNDLKRIFALLFPKDSLEERHLEWDEEWENQFYLFLALQAIHGFQNTKFDTSLAPQALVDVTIPDTPCLCFDIEIKTGDQSFYSRLAISPQMRQSLKQKYALKTQSYSSEISSAITTQVHVVIGSASLPKEEWRQAKPGDFLILDSCSYTPDDEKGRVVLTINNLPIFRAKIKDRSLKLLEYPLLQEVQTPMTEYEDEEEFDDGTFEAEDDESITDEPETETAEETGEEKPPLPSPKDLLRQSQSTETRVVNLEKIPLTISVEIARIQMSIQQLLELAPGNMLDLEITPDKEVDLVVNGRCIGKGELLKLGETLGVRILDKA